MTYIYSKWDDDACRYYLTHWGWVTLICVSKITIIGSDNGLSPGRRQAIIWTSVGILLIGPLGTNFSEILIEIYTFSFKKRHLEMSPGKWQPFCLGRNELKPIVLHFMIIFTQNIHPFPPVKKLQRQYSNVFKLWQEWFYMVLYLSTFYCLIQHIIIL